MKILLLSKYGRLGSSSRLRFYQYLSYLKKQGMKIDTMPLFDDGYVSNLYAGRRKNHLAVLSAYGRRITRLMNRSQYDLIWLEAELFPFLPAWGESLLSRSAVPLVVDYDDAIFHRYGRNRNFMVRLLFGKKIEAIMRSSDLVIAGSDYLVQHALNAGANRVEYLPTVVDLVRYPEVANDENQPFTIGWIGSPVTAKYIAIADSALSEFCGKGRGRLVLVGANGIDVPFPSHEAHTWSENTEAAEIAGFDLGIMPLPDEPWERGKCGYKLIQYMAGSIPVVASPVGANTKIVDHGINGFLVSGASEWLEAFMTLADDPALRNRMGKAGLNKVRSEYCIEVTAPRLSSLLSSL